MITELICFELEVCICNGKQFQFKREWVWHGCACVKISTRRGGGGIAPFWGSANLPETVLRDVGYPAIVSHYRAIWATNPSLETEALPGGARQPERERLLNAERRCLLGVSQNSRGLVNPGFGTPN